MNIFYISDLHIDFYVKEKNECDKLSKSINKYIIDLGVFDIPVKERDVIVLAGDLSHYFSQNKEMLSQLKSLFKNVIVVPGNHEYYLISKKQKKKYNFNSNNKINELKDFCKSIGVWFLDGDVINIDGFKIGGCSGYWDNSFIKRINSEKTDSEITDLYYKRMNDINYIMFGEEPYNIPLAYGSKMLKSTYNTFDFRKEQFQKLKDISEHGSIDLMISHYCPYREIELPEEYEDDDTSTFYIFDGEEYRNKMTPKFWIFGHIHKKYNFISTGTNYRCNPFGYPREIKKEVFLEKIILNKELDRNI